ncbi:delta 1-pyrroline-5-carboxylate reductase [Monosporozyma unispora]|nr:delta 1-pyrroline-5-carboxylate reductase [Kazachstania unispora]
MGYTLTMLGCGVMGQAILSAIYNAPKSEDANIQSLYPSKIIACNGDATAANQVNALIKGYGSSPNGIVVDSTFGDNIKAVKECDVVILGTKPFLVEKVMNELKEVVKGKLIISIAAGWTISQLQNYSDCVSRIMTNTPAKYGYGCAVIAHSEEVSSHERELVNELISHVGVCVELPEKNMDAATSLVGSGPAYVLLMIESMMESGIKMGIPLNESLKCTLQVLEGTAKMVERSGTHPGVLKHQVCTPGGTTIAGLCKMEEYGVKNGIIKGVEEGAIVAARLGKK